MDYRKFYDLETYLFEEVGSRFRTAGKLSAEDFMMILIWKANRAKTKHVRRLEGLAGNLESAVLRISDALFAAADSRAKMSILIESWRFRLPTASAILSVLWPQEFTVYDIRVCNALGRPYDLQNRPFERLWAGYKEFVEAVTNASDYDNLRDKDRYLWGKSFWADLQQTLGSNRQAQQFEVDDG